jgi:hypothetical protein
MSNDGRSIGDHLREIEAAVNQDSSADRSATREAEPTRDRSNDVTNRAPSENQPSQSRRMPRREGKDRSRA